MKISEKSAENSEFLVTLPFNTATKKIEILNFD